MPATTTDVIRTDDTAGDTFEVFETDAGRAVQSMALSPEVQGELLSHTATGGAAENTHSVKASPGRLFRIDALLDPGVGAARYLMVFNLAAAPAGGETPVLRALIPAGGQVSFDLGVYGKEFTTGIQVAISTTIATLTLPGGAEGYFQAAFV